MHHSLASLSAVAAVLLSVLPAAQAGLYTKNSPVIQVNAKNFDQLIAKSNHTSIVEFFAPWCGHCQNLKPAYEKAARNLDGLAHVAAVDCDDDANKQFCGMQGVQGFPTLKIVRPGKKTGRPVIEDYKGPRTATGIVDAVVAKINNHVQKVTDADVDSFLATAGQDKPVALLFSEKGSASPLLKSIAIDFLDVISVGQVRSKETKTLKKFGIENFPALVLIPTAGADPILYDGELKKDAMVQFLSQAGAPNPDPPVSTASKKAKTSSDSTKKPAASKASKAPKASKESTSTSAETETATKSEQTVPVIVESALPIPTINTPEKLSKQCLHEKSHTCVLALVPAGDDNAEAQTVLDNLAELAHKHAQSKRHLFPFYALPASNEGAASLLKSLDLSGDVELVAINARRGWWRHFDGQDFSHESLERWIDAIRLSEGEKKKLPEGLVVAAAEETLTSETPEASESADAEEIKHEEL